VVDADHFTIDLAEHNATVGTAITPFGGKKATMFLGPGASGTGSGGGSTITYVCPHISDGDRIIDSRGRSITLKTIRAMGEYYARTGVDQRGGLESSVTGEGGTDISVFDYRITSLDPPWIAVYGGGGNGITLSGMHAHVDHIAVRGPFNAGINVSATAYGAQVGSYTVQDAIIGADIAGCGTILGRGRIIDPVQVGVRIWGYLLTVTFDEVTNNPFTPVAVGSSIVTVFLPGYPKTAGRVRFAGQVQRLWLRDRRLEHGRLSLHRGR
jgi:hypothetical protein